MNERCFTLRGLAPAIAAAFVFAASLPAHAADPLPAWKDTAPKKAIVAFVERVTKEDPSDFVPPAERIAVFDNEREWEDDRASHIGKLDKAWDEATAKGWTLVDMKADWATVFPPQP